MRLAKIIIRKRAGRFLTPKATKFNNSRPESPVSSSKWDGVGEFWFIEGDLNIDEAKAIARRMEADGISGRHFHGKAAEQRWKAKTKSRQNRVQSLPRNKHEALSAKKSVSMIPAPPSVKSKDPNPFEPVSTSGRSYGLLDSDDEDEDMMDQNEEMTEVIPPMVSGQNGVNGAVDSSASSKNSMPTSPEMQESTQTTQSTTRDASPTPDDRGDEELSPIMPGSFVFEEDAVPSSPTYSSGRQEGQSMLTDYHLHRTPMKPGYVNPGIAIEGRYNSGSPLPPSSKRNDLSPYHFAYFLRKKQEMERHSDRSLTPSLMSDGFEDDWGYSEREKAERERRRRDLMKFRQEKKRRLVEEQALSSATSPKRSREESDTAEEEATPAKKSKASALFQSILAEKDDDFNHSTRSVSYGLFGSDSKSTGSETEKENEPIAKSASTTPRASFAAPTPSPSPPPQLAPPPPPPPQVHAPKISSSLRNVSVQSPAASPRKNEMDQQQQLQPQLQQKQQQQEEQQESRTVKQIVGDLDASMLLNIAFPQIAPPRWASWDQKLFTSVTTLLS